MSKEWLEFLGGLFAFLAVLVPIVRNSWPKLRPKIASREFLLLLVAISVLATFLSGLVGLWLRWDHVAEADLFLFSLLGIVAMFAVNRAKITRFDIAGFVLGVTVCAAFAAHEIKTAEDQGGLSFLQRQPAAPSPSLIPDPK